MINKQVISSIPVSSSGVYRPIQVNVLLNNCKQNISSLSLLVGTTVPGKTNPLEIKHISIENSRLDFIESSHEI